MEEEEEGTPVSSYWLKLKKIYQRRRAKARKSGKVHHSKVGKGDKDNDGYCTDMRLFEGSWVYAEGCDSNSYDVEIYPKGRRKYIIKETLVSIILCQLLQLQNLVLI